MCLAVPLKLIEIKGKEAVGESLGMRRSVRVDFIENPQVGDYVIVHAGFAIERLPEAPLWGNSRRRRWWRSRGSDRV